MANVSPFRHGIVRASHRLTGDTGRSKWVPEGALRAGHPLFALGLALLSRHEAQTSGRTRLCVPMLPRPTATCLVRHVVSLGGVSYHAVALTVSAHFVCMYGEINAAGGKYIHGSFDDSAKSGGRLQEKFLFW